MFISNAANLGSPPFVTPAALLGLGKEEGRDLRPAGVAAEGCGEAGVRGVTEHRHWLVIEVHAAPPEGADLVEGPQPEAGAPLHSGRGKTLS